MHYGSVAISSLPVDCRHIYVALIKAEKKMNAQVIVFEKFLKGMKFSSKKSLPKRKR